MNNEKILRLHLPGLLQRLLPGKLLAAPQMDIIDLMTMPPGRMPVLVSLSLLALLLGLVNYPGYNKLPLSSRPGPKVLEIL